MHQRGTKAKGLSGNYQKNFRTVGYGQKDTHIFTSSILWQFEHYWHIIHFHDKKFTIVRYTEKPKKSVTLLSSQHHDDAVGESGKPDIVEFYNSTKAGVDTLDQLVSYVLQYQEKTQEMAIVCFL